MTIQKSLVAVAVFGALFAAVVHADDSMINLNERLSNAIQDNANNHNVGTAARVDTAYNAVKMAIPAPVATVAPVVSAQEQSIVSNMQALQANPTKETVSNMTGSLLDAKDTASRTAIGNALNTSSKIIKHTQRPSIAVITPATETVKGAAFAKGAPDQELGASKLVTTVSPDKKEPATYVTTAIQHDTSAKRAQVQSVASAQPVSASAYKLAEGEAQSRAVAGAVSAPVAAPEVKATVTPPAQNKAAVVAPAAVTSSNVPVAESFQDDATQAVNDLIDAHNENVTAIEDNSAHIASLEQSTNQRFADMGKQVNDNRKRAAAGVAGVAAIASIPQVTGDQSFTVGAGLGDYDNQQSVAVGFSARVSKHIVTKAAVSAGTFGGAAVGAGMSWGW